MERNQVRQVVVTVLETILQRRFEPGADIARADTPGWDSLKHMEIVFALEEELGVEFPEEVLADLDSAGAIVDRVMDRREA